MPLHAIQADTVIRQHTDDIKRIERKSQRRSAIPQGRSIRAFGRRIAR
jgi:hypothetical protein